MKVYCIFSDSGEYSERIVHALRAVASFEKADLIVDKLNKLTEFIANVMSAAENQFEKEYPSFSSPELLSLKDRPKVSEQFAFYEKICSYGGGTAEQKAEYKKLQQEHSNAITAFNKLFIASNEKHRELFVIYNNKKQKAKQEYIEQHAPYPEELQEVAQHPTYYDSVFYHQEFDLEE